jgi:hypothetical protein
MLEIQTAAPLPKTANNRMPIPSLTGIAHLKTKHAFSLKRFTSKTETKDLEFW